MIITAITAQLKNKTRVNLFLDGEFVCGLSAVAVVRAGLKAGDSISQQQLDELILQSDSAACMDTALKYLGYKPVSAAKMRKYLVDKDFDRKIADLTVDRLIELGYLDDKALAAAYIKNCRQKYGKGLIRHKLREIGISSADIEDVLPDDETDSVVAVAQKYLKTHKPDRNKLYNFLAGRGFSAEAARKALGLLNQQDDDDL